MNRIYLDNAATTKMDQRVIKAMQDAFAFFGNPSSIHTVGQEARKIVDDAREFTAFFLDCKPTEVIFTSGGSESDNLAIRGIVDQIRKKSDNKKPHIITTAIEHHAVLHTISDLEKKGKIEASYVKPDKNGIIGVKDIENAIKSNTTLISVMYVNNETGCVQPIREIGKMIEKLNKSRGEKKIYFHSDAVQAAEFFEMGTNYLHVDLLTLTAHKIHGPKGVGALFIKKGTPVSAQITGGDHEFGLRAGTENVSGIAGIAEAIKQVVSCQLSVISRVAKLRDKLEDFILKNIPDTSVNGDKTLRSPHITNISFKNAEGEAIILNLDFLGISVSSGSACTARSLESSHVLTAMDIPEELAHGAIRFSLSRDTTEEEIDKVCEVLPEVIKKLRDMSPFSS